MVSNLLNVELLMIQEQVDTRVILVGCSVCGSDFDLIVFTESEWGLLQQWRLLLKWFQFSKGAVDSVGVVVVGVGYVHGMY